MKVHKLEGRKLKIFLVDTGMAKPFWGRKSHKELLVKSLDVLDRWITQSKIFEKLKKRKKDFDFTVTLCGKQRIQTLNRRFRKKNAPTDVLSFPMYENLVEDSDLFENINLGDIVICKDIAQKQARAYEVTEKEEFVRLLVHGFLHLFGYDHERSRKHEIKMFKEQEIILGKILGGL